jgi:hypothetical protein
VARLLLPGVVRRSSSETPTEVWTYNFDPDRLMQRIRFENGLVVKTESVGCGSWNDLSARTVDARTAKTHLGKPQRTAANALLLPATVPAKPAV